MSTRPTRTMLLLRVLIPLAVLATGAVVSASRGRDDSALPPSVPQSAIAPGETPSSASAPGLKVSVVRAGQEPYAWLLPGKIVKSFLTDGPKSLNIVAFAGLAAHPELQDEIEWEIAPPAGFVLPPRAQLRGRKLAVQLQRPAGNPTGMGAPLTFSLTARVESDGQLYEDTITLVQDLRDRLRQEYVDLERADVPLRRQLIDELQYKRLYGKKYPNILFSDLNWSKQPGSEERYPFIVATEKLVATLQQIRKEYGGPLVFASGFRNPVRQTVVHEAVSESHHQYGRAADLYVPPDSAQPKTGRDVAWPADWLRLAAASIRGGGVWIEPMLDCHVNTAGCHVHVDVRDHGAQSRIVRVAGRVTDPLGQPVTGAQVQLAGMPAVTDARGFFSLKHVLVPRAYDLLVDAPGRGEMTQSVEVGDTGAMASVRFSPDPLPVLVARAVGTPAARRGQATVRVAIRNNGQAAASAIQLLADAPELAGKVREIAPATVAALAPGKEALLRVGVVLPRRSATTVPPFALQLTASYTTPRGDARTQTLGVQVGSTTPLTVPKPTPAAKPAVTRPASQPEPAPPSVLPEKETVPKSVPDAGAAAGGALVGGAAAVAAAGAKRIGKKPREPRPDAPAPTPAPDAAPASH